ncbi:MAG TPA: hypothetical protein DCL61_26640 [Cyanobacteria bacterium UBA12227]|nr:hypothetical protein [Cyanobacteria bacterium UBA12227]HAX88726.1 hypothetical protein [Cyanobacteria bacterium UBA11370]
MKSDWSKWLPTMWKQLITFKGQDRSLWKRLTKNFSISLGGSVALTAIRLVQTVILTKSLAIADYGKVLIILNLFTFLDTFLGVRVNDVIYKFYPQFKQNKDAGALRGLLILCLGLSLVVGLAIAGGMFIFSPWIADRFYDDTNLALPFRIYAGAGLIIAFSGFSTSILRLNDSFTAIVIPQVCGAALTLAILTLYLYYADGYSVEFVVGAFALGVFVQTLIPLVQSIRIVSPELFLTSESLGFKELRRYRPELVPTLFHTNLVGYLKVASDTGGIFLLGILASAEQVAIYGVAQQLIRPLVVIFRRNINTSVSPEIVKLWAEGKLEQLKNFVNSFVKVNFIVGGFFIIFLISLAPKIILLVSNENYLKALPIFYILSVTNYLSLISIILYPVCLIMGMMSRQNLILVCNLIALGIFIFIGLDGVKMAIIQLVGTINLWLFLEIPLMKKLHRLQCKQ